MRLVVKVGDVLDETADVLICTANPMLMMTGGVNGRLFDRGGAAIQEELRQYLSERKISWVEPGSVVRSGPGPLHVKHILHAVGVTALYESSPELVSRTLDRALRLAAELAGRSVVSPAIATGYGPLTMKEFTSALKGIILNREYHPIEEIRVVLRREEYAQQVMKVMAEK